LKVSAEYTCNIDWQATYESLSKSPFPTELNNKGTITVYIKHSAVNIFASGQKMQITSPNVKEKKQVYNLIQPYLVPSQNPKPYKAHFNISWPHPKLFQLAACNKTRTYVILPVSISTSIAIATFTPAFTSAILAGPHVPSVLLYSFFAYAILKAIYSNWTDSSQRI